MFNREYYKELYNLTVKELIDIDSSALDELYQQ